MDRLLSSDVQWAREEPHCAQKRTEGCLASWIGIVRHLDSFIPKRVHI